MFRRGAASPFVAASRRRAYDGAMSLELFLIHGSPYARAARTRAQGAALRNARAVAIARRPLVASLLGAESAWPSTAFKQASRARSLARSVDARPRLRANVSTQLALSAALDAC